MLFNELDAPGPGQASTVPSAAGLCPGGDGWASRRLHQGENRMHVSGAYVAFNEAIAQCTVTASAIVLPDALNG